MSNNTLTVSTPKELTAYLEKAQSSIAKALPKHLTPDRMMRLAVTCFSTTKGLRDCTPQSILGSIITAAQLGLEPGIAGQGYLIPYKSTCTFVPGWQGLVGLLNNSGRATAWTNAVYEGDEWDFQLGSHPRCFHRPGPNYGNPDCLTWVYACGQVNGSALPVVEAWPMVRVWHHRDRFNKVGQKHYSYEHPEMYARKVVLLQVLKYMPRSIELNNAMQIASNDSAGRPSILGEDGMIIDVAGEDRVTEEAPKMTETRSAPARESRQASEAPASSTDDNKITARQELRLFMDSEGIELKQLEAVCRKFRLLTGSIPLSSLDDLSHKAVMAILGDQKTFLAEMKGGQ